jgi:hypothetical protein
MRPTCDGLALPTRHAREAMGASSGEKALFQNDYLLLPKRDRKGVVFGAVGIHPDGHPHRRSQGQQLAMAHTTTRTRHADGSWGGTLKSGGGSDMHPTCTPT